MIDRTSDRQTLTLVATIIVLIYVTSLIVAILFFYIYSSYALAPVEESFKNSATSSRTRRTSSKPLSPSSPPTSR